MWKPVEQELVCHMRNLKCDHMALSEIIKFPPSHDKRKALCASQRGTAGSRVKSQVRIQKPVCSLSHLQLPVTEIDPAWALPTWIHRSLFNPLLVFQVISIAMFPSIYPSFLFLRISSFQTSELLMMPQNLIASSSWFYPLFVFLLFHNVFLLDPPGRSLRRLKRKSLSHGWLCDPMDGSPPGSPGHGIFQARTLEWVAIPFSRGSSLPRDQTWVSHIAGRFFYHLSHEGSPSLLSSSTQILNFKIIRFLSFRKSL